MTIYINQDNSNNSYSSNSVFIAPTESAGSLVESSSYFITNRSSMDSSRSILVFKRGVPVLVDIDHMKFKEKLKLKLQILTGSYFTKANKVTDAHPLVSEYVDEDGEKEDVVSSVNKKIQDLIDDSCFKARRIRSKLWF